MVDTLAPAHERVRLIETMFPRAATAVFWAAIAVSAALICVGLFWAVSANLTAGHLILSVGLGLLLAAFGSQATLSTGRVIMAGAAAVAMILFGTLQWSIRADDYVRIKLNSVNYDRYDPAFRIAGQEVLGRFWKFPSNPASSVYDAIIFRRDVNTSFISLWLVASDDREQEIRISQQTIAPLLGRQEVVSWDFDEGTMSILDPITRSPVAKASDRIQLTRGPAPSPAGGIRLVGAAFAQEARKATAPEALPGLLEALESDDATIRRGARSELAGLPVSAVPDLIRYLHDRFDSYRIKLGVVVGLTEMLRAEKTLAPRLSEALNDGDISLLVAAAGDPDRTVRIYATEFLYDLGDPRAVAPSLDLADRVGDENARYNLLFLTQGGVQRLPQAEKPEIGRQLEAISEGAGPDTRQLIQQIQQDLRQ